MALLTVKAVSEWLQVKPSTIYLWAEHGGIPHMKLGRLLRFDAKEIEAWLQQQRHDATSERIQRRRPHSSHHVDTIIAQAKRAVYTPSRGKPDQDRATGKGDEDGSV
jgi:excisionase family DNA binding protein